MSHSKVTDVWGMRDVWTRIRRLTSRPLQETLILALRPNVVHDVENSIQDRIQELISATKLTLTQPPETTKKKVSK
jgi:hypothetical protein